MTQLVVESSLKDWVHPPKRFRLCLGWLVCQKNYSEVTDRFSLKFEKGMIWYKNCASIDWFVCQKNYSKDWVHPPRRFRLCLGWLVCQKNYSEVTDRFSLKFEKIRIVPRLIGLSVKRYGWIFMEVWKGHDMGQEITG